MQIKRQRYSGCLGGKEFQEFETGNIESKYCLFRVSLMILIPLEKEVLTIAVIAFHWISVKYYFGSLKLLPVHLSSKLLEQEDHVCSQERFGSSSKACPSLARTTLHHDTGNPTPKW